MPGQMPPNAAGARRRRAELLARQPRLRPESRAYLDTYRPVGVTTTHWRQLRPVVEAILTFADITGVDSFRKHCTHVAMFAAWADSEGWPLTIEGLLDERCIEEYVSVGMSGCSPRSRATRRSKLRALATRCRKSRGAQTPAVVLPHAAVKPPYSQAEIAALLRAARSQPTPARKRHLCAVISLGAGAGLDSADLRHLRRRDIDDRGDAGVWVNVPGQRPRTVVVREVFEHAAREGMAGLDADQLLTGRLVERRNIASRAAEQAVLHGDLPRLDQGRLRSTWLATLMSERVPLATLLAAAGLKSARTLTDLLPHLPAPTDLGVLRGGEQR